ncbi:hypothetical protein [Deinococcus reticulitermitis]|nr:hypothetical protein [Deinococcus reticulitermitis]
MMLRLIIGGVDLAFLPPPEAVSVDGGGRPVSERVTLDGRIVATRSPLPASRRLTVIAPEGFAISAADAEAIRALGDGPFSVTLIGYEPGGTFGGCTFEAPPRFPLTRDPRYRGYELAIYLPQGGP